MRIIQDGKESSPIRSDAYFPEWKPALIGKEMCGNTSFDDRIKETQDKDGILDKKKRKLNYFVVKLTNEDRATNRVNLMLR